MGPLKKKIMFHACWLKINIFLLPNEINLLAKIPSKLKKKKIFGIAKRDETKNVLIQRRFLLFRCLKWTSRLSLFMLLCDSFVDV